MNGTDDWQENKLKRDGEAFNSAIRSIVFPLPLDRISDWIDIEMKRLGYFFQSSDSEAPFIYNLYCNGDAVATRKYIRGIGQVDVIQNSRNIMVGMHIMSSPHDKGNPTAEDFYEYNNINSAVMVDRLTVRWWVE